MSKLAPFTARIVKDLVKLTARDQVIVYQLVLGLSILDPADPEFEQARRDVEAASQRRSRKRSAEEAQDVIRLPEPGEVEPFGPTGEFQVGDGYTSKPKP